MNIYEYKNAYYVLSADLSEDQQVWTKKEGTYRRGGDLAKVDDVETLQVGDLLSLSVSVRKELVDEFTQYLTGTNATNPVLGYTRFVGLVTKAEARGGFKKQVTMILGSANLTMWIGSKGHGYYRNDIRKLASAIPGFVPVGTD